MTPSRLSDLELVPLAPSHTDLVHRLFSDPRTWTHLPAGRHTDRAVSEAMIAGAQHSWTDHGLGDWAVFGAAGHIKDREAQFLGIAGLRLIDAGPLWNVGFRMDPGAWGRGIATRVAAVGMERARELAPHVPITARVLTSNPGSIRVIEKLGLQLRWEGPASVPVPDDAPGRIYSDQDLTEGTLALLIAHA